MNRRLQNLAFTRTEIQTLSEGLHKTERDADAECERILHERNTEL